MKKKLVILGAGGHGRVCADVADQSGYYYDICFLDDRYGEASGSVEIFPIVGKCMDYVKWINEAVFFVGMGNSHMRQSYLERIQSNGGTVVSLVHPMAVIGSNVTIEPGTVVMAGAVINTGSRIGKGVIINTCSSVDHDNQIGNYCHVSVGAHLAGTVNIGKHTMIGAGATVINNVNIGEYCMIGAGAVVAKDIEEKGTYVGVPARKI